MAIFSPRPPSRPGGPAPARATSAPPAFPVPHAHARTPKSPWEGFVAGLENALTLASTQALARLEPRAISPLIIHGPSGAGKSRLLEGLVAERLTIHPDAVLACLSADEFVSACMEANESPDGWFELRDRFRNVELLVLDDLHALERSPMAMEELAHTLDALDQIGASVAGSSKTAPAHWTGWPKRLVSRLSGGLAARLDAPTTASFRRYLMDRTANTDLRLSYDAIDTLAESADGYRVLDGWLTQLEFITKIEGKPADRVLVESILAEQSQSHDTRFDQIIAAVAAKFGVTVRDIKKPDRRPLLTVPRQIAMLLAKELTPLSVSEIGRRFGNRDPATVRHSFEMAKKRLQSDPALAASIESLASRWRRPVEA